jgi:hypothetical protein
MSLETTLARAEADAAAEDWRLHKRHCPRCAHRARIREWQWLCPEGMKTRDANVAAMARLAEERRLDRLPSPDQERLF